MSIFCLESVFKVRIIVVITRIIIVIIKQWQKKNKLHCDCFFRHRDEKKHNNKITSKHLFQVSKDDKLI